MTRSSRSLVGVALSVAVLAATSACASDHLRQRDAKTVRVGQVLGTSAAAAIRGTTSHVVLPSGRVDLTLGEPVDEIAAQDAAGATALRPADGAVAVGVSWTLNRGGLPDSPNRQLASPVDIFGVPQPVTLRLVTDGTRRVIPDVGTLEVPGTRARTAAWLVVPAGVRQWRFEVTLAGVTQVVDARTGTVTPGPAAPLYRALPMGQNGDCEIETDSYGSCSVEYAVGYPYVDGVGWAPAGKVFALLSLYQNGEFDNGDVRVAGVRAVHELDGTGRTYAVYPVTPARTYSLRGSDPYALTGSLTPGGTA